LDQLPGNGKVGNRSARAPQATAAKEEDTGDGSCRLQEAILLSEWVAGFDLRMRLAGDVQRSTTPASSRDWIRQLINGSRPLFGNALVITPMLMNACNPIKNVIPDPSSN
jgi:hypothetical protein